MREIRAKVEGRGRVTADEALWLWKNASDGEMRELAQMVRARYHGPDACTYMLMRIINYTNVCVAQCDYCAFYTLPGGEGGYVLTQDQVFAKIDELIALVETWWGSMGDSIRRWRWSITAICLRRCVRGMATRWSFTR